MGRMRYLAVVTVLATACTGSLEDPAAAPVDHTSAQPDAAIGGEPDAGTIHAPTATVDAGSPWVATDSGTPVAADGGIGAGHHEGVPAVDAGLDAATDSGPPPPPVAHCSPTAAGPYVLLEGETVAVTITCKTGLVMPTALSFDPLPLGAAFDQATATLTWKPALDQAATYELTLRASPWNESGTVKLFVVERWDDALNVPVKDATKYTEEYGLPVLHLTTDPGLNGDEYTPATIVYRGHSYIGAQAKTRGATSSTYPKKSYTLKFTKEDKFGDPDRAGGFNEKRKVTLITSFDDNSYLRQRLSFEIWNRLDPAHIQVQTYSAVVFLNGVYHGLYTVADHIDSYLMEDFGLNQDGNLYKTRSHDANFRVNADDGGKKPSVHEGFTKEEGTPIEGEPGAFDDLDAFIAWVETSTSAAFASEVDTRIARKEYEDWWIFVSFAMADDTAGKNTYHYHDPTLAGSRWRLIPWDLNESFGQDWQTVRTGAQSTQPEGYYVMRNALFERILADATFGPALKTRYGATLDGTYASNAVVTLLDSMVLEIDASARRDEQKWQTQYRAFPLWSGLRKDYTTYDQEVQYVRQWIADRHAYLSTLY